MDGGGIHVVDGGQVDDDEVQCLALLLRGLLRAALVLGQRILHRVHVGEVERRVDAQQQQALHLARLWVLLHIPAHAGLGFSSAARCASQK